MLFTNRFGSQLEYSRLAAMLGLVACIVFGVAQTAPETETETESAETESSSEDMTEAANWTNADFPILSVVPQMSWKGGAIAPEQWKADEQPNLAQELSEAKPLEFVEIAPGPQSVNNGQRPYLVPNVDGTWDMIYPHFGKYFSAQQMIIHDFGTGETQSQFVGTRKGDTLLTKGKWDFHMAPSYYTNGKLILPNQAYSSLMFAIYDPEQNKFTHAVQPFGKTLVRGGNVLGEDGKLYGIGWNPKTKDGFIAYWFDPKTEESWQSKPFGTLNKDTQTLYASITMSGDWVYADYGHQPWNFVAYNFKTNEGKVLATSQNILGNFKTITFAAIEGGLMGTIEHPDTINGNDKVADERMHFWVHDGKLIPRTAEDENTPWSGKPPVRLSRPGFAWQREHQQWLPDFKPQPMTLKQFAASSSDRLLQASDATLSVKDANKPGWIKTEGESTYGGVAYQNDGSADKTANNNGVATFTVSFSEPGEYYLYFHGRSLKGRANAGMAFSRGDQEAKPFAAAVADNFSRVHTEAAWEKAFVSLHNKEAFVYNVAQEEVGKPLTFNVATGYTGAYKMFPGMAWDAVLFSKDSNKITDVIPDIARNSDKIDMHGHVVMPYKFKNGPVQSIKYDVTLRNAAMRGLLELNDHILFALPDQYGQQVFYNLDTQQIMRYEVGSSPYSMGLAHDKLYVSGYPGSQLYEYTFRGEDGQPLQRPTRIKAAQISQVNTTHSPLAGTFEGADGNVYNGGITYGRQRDGGGFGWYDPKTGKIDGMPLPHRLFWGTSADNGRYIIFSAKPGESKENLQLMGWDTKTHKFIYQENIKEFGAAGPLTEALPGGLVMGHASAEGEGYLYGLNAATGKILWLKAVPERPTTSFSQVRRHRHNFRRGPDGDIWAFMGNTLVRIDPRTAHVTAVGKLPNGQSPAQIAFAKGNVYIAWGGSVRQIKGLRTEEINTTDKSQHTAAQ